MNNRELDQQIHKMLDGKWNLPYGHIMSVRVAPGKGEYKKVKKRLKSIALSRGLDVKIERPSRRIMTDILRVTFEKKKEKI